MKMGHIYPAADGNNKHYVADGDGKHFVIDPVTRSIANTTSKLTLTQKDHNSERYTFEIPKNVEGHDMSLCNKIEVHFINIDAKTREKKIGIYEVNDVQEVTSETGEKLLTFTWLISRRATEYSGTLSFAVRFACFNEGDDLPEYAWNTAIHSNISIIESIDSSEATYYEYYDLLQQWLNRVEKAVPSISENGRWIVDGKETEYYAEPPIPYIGENGNWFVGDTDQGVRAGGTPGSILVDQRLQSVDDEGNNIYVQTYSTPDSETGGSKLSYHTFTAPRGPEGPQGKHVKSISYSKTDKNGGNVYDVTMSDDSVIKDAFTAPKGAKGEMIRSVEYNGTDAEGGNIYNVIMSDGSIIENAFTAPRGFRGEPGISCTHKWNGTVLEVSSASGTTSQDLKGDSGLVALTCSFVLGLETPESEEDELIPTEGFIETNSGYFNREPAINDTFNMTAYNDVEYRSFLLTCKIDEINEELIAKYSVISYVENTGRQGPPGEVITNTLYYNTVMDLGNEEPSAGTTKIGEPLTNFNHRPIVGEYFIVIAINNNLDSYSLLCRVLSVSDSVNYSIDGVIKTSGLPGNGIKSIQSAGNDADGGNIYAVSMDNGRIHNITAPKGERGFTTLSTSKVIDMESTPEVDDEYSYPSTMFNRTPVVGDVTLVLIDDELEHDVYACLAECIGVNVADDSLYTFKIKDLVRISTLLKHEWNGTTLNITTSSGTTSSNLQGPQGPRGFGIYSISITEV